SGKVAFTFSLSAFSTVLFPAHFPSKLFRRSVSQTAVGPLLVVLSPPQRDLPSRLEQIPEPTHVQTLLPHPPVKTFHASASHRRRRRRLSQIGLSACAAVQNTPA